MFIVILELAGINKKNIDIVLDKNKLTISGIRKETTPSNLKSYYQVEINFGPFERFILLPENIDESSIKAEYENGFLNITIKKQPQNKKRKNIHLKIT